MSVAGAPATRTRLDDSRGLAAAAGPSPPPPAGTPIKIKTPPVGGGPTKPEQMPDA
jgi:hypothetical protein